MIVKLRAFFDEPEQDRFKCDYYVIRSAVSSIELGVGSPVIFAEIVGDGCIVTYIAYSNAEEKAAIDRELSERLNVEVLANIRSVKP